MAARSCSVSFKDVCGIRHTVEVEAESLYEAAVMGVKRLREDPWIEAVGRPTLLEIQVREPGTTHTISLNQVERWLASTSGGPQALMKKNKLKMILVKAGV